MFRTHGHQVAVCGDDTTTIQRPSDASASALPPAGVPLIIQFEGGALTMLERFLAHAWSGVPEAAWIIVCVAAVLGVLYLNGRFLHTAPFTARSAELRIGLDAIVTPGPTPGQFHGRAARSAQ